MENRTIHQFGSFGLDAVAKVLLRDGEPVHLTRKAAETLLILVEQSPQVVTKEEIMSRVWPDRVVDEANLTQNIAVIRRALGAEKGTPAYIETFPGRGYRILGPVQQLNSSSAAPPPAPVEEAAPVPARSAGRVSPWLFVAALLAVALVATHVWLRQPSAPASPHVVPVTQLAGKEYQPAISPDGSAVAFLWQPDTGQPARIYIQTGGVASPRLLSDAPGDYSSPVWSPDGRSLACLRFRPSSGEIVILPRDGGRERILAHVLPTRFGLADRHLDWSPDGRSLAVDDSPSLSEPLSIYLIDIESGARTRLSEPEDIIIGDVDPRFSPDGSRISFIRAFHRANRDLFTVPLHGGKPTQITSDSRQVSSQVWAADGHGLVVASNRGGEFRLWAVSPGRAPQARGVYAQYPIQLDFNRKTSALVYSVVQTDPNIYGLDLANPPRWRRLIASTAQDASPQFSPDGKRIAFRSDRGGEESIWVAGADGSNPTRVADPALRPSVPRWSPDSHTLVFNGSVSRLLHVASDASGSWQTRALGVRGVHPVYSPDGAWIYAGADNAIVRYAANGGAATTVVPTRGLSLSIDPEGKFLYFVREPAGSALWRAGVESGHMEPVLDGLVPYCTSCWALAPGALYYLGARPGQPGQQSIFQLDLATRATRVVADYPEPILPIGIGPFSFSPDYRTLLTVRLDPSNSDLLRVDGFR